jgi:hypothetical protein
MSETGRQDQADSVNRPAQSTDATQQAARREHLDELLDEALAETFPASDPIAVHEQLKKDAPPR